MTIVKALLIIIATSIFTPLVYGGSYILTSTSVLTNGIGVSFSDTLDTSGSCFKANTDNTLFISGFTLKQGHTWKSVTINPSASTNITVTDSAGNVIVGPVSASAATETTLSLADKEAGKNGTNLIVKIEHNANCVNSLTVSYENQGVIVYPAPYVISEGSASIAYDILNDASVTLEIYDSRGKRVKRIYKNQVVSARRSPKLADNWDGTNEQGNRVASGIYLVYVSVKYLSQTNGISGDYTDTFRFVVLR